MLSSSNCVTQYLMHRPESKNTLDFALFGRRIEHTPLIVLPAPSDHCSVMFNIRVQLNRSSRKVLVPNKTAFKRITKRVLEDSTNSPEFLDQVRCLSKNTSPFMVLRPRQYKNELLTTLLRCDEILQIRKEISYYWRALISVNELTRFSPDQKAAFLFL